MATFQGPTRPKDSESTFRETGTTVPKSNEGASVRIIVVPSSNNSSSSSGILGAVDAGGQGRLTPTQAVRFEGELLKQAQAGGSQLPMSKERLLAASQGRDISQNIQNQLYFRSQGSSYSTSQQLARVLDIQGQQKTSTTSLQMSSATPTPTKKSFFQEELQAEKDVVYGSKGGRFIMKQLQNPSLIRSPFPLRTKNQTSGKYNVDFFPTFEDVNKNLGFKLLPETPREVVILGSIGGVISKSKTAMNLINLGLTGFGIKQVSEGKTKEGLINIGLGITSFGLSNNKAVTEKLAVLKKLETTPKAVEITRVLETDIGGLDIVKGTARVEKVSLSFPGGLKVEPVSFDVQAGIPFIKTREGQGLIIEEGLGKTILADKKTIAIRLSEIKGQARELSSQIRRVVINDGLLSKSLVDDSFSAGVSDIIVKGKALSQAKYNYGIDMLTGDLRLEAKIKTSLEPSIEKIRSLSVSKTLPSGDTLFISGRTEALKLPAKLKTDTLGLMKRIKLDTNGLGKEFDSVIKSLKKDTSLESINTDLLQVKKTKLSAGLDVVEALTKDFIKTETKMLERQKPTSITTIINPLISKQKSIPVTIQTIDKRVKTEQIPKINIAQREMVKQSNKNIAVSLNKLENQLRSIDRVTNNTKQVTRPELRLRSLTSMQTITQPKLKTKGSLLMFYNPKIPEFFRKKKKPFYFDDVDGKIKKQFNKSFGSFTALTKRFGKIKTIGTFGSADRAYKEAFKVAKKSLAVSIAVKNPQNELINLPKTFGFEQSKRNPLVLVQQRGQRLGSIQERLEIQKAKRLELFYPTPYFKKKKRSLI